MLAEPRKKSRGAGRPPGKDGDAGIEFDAKRWCDLELLALVRSVAMQLPARWNWRLEVALARRAA